MRLLDEIVTDEWQPRRRASRRSFGVSPSGILTGTMLALFLVVVLGGCATTGSKTYPYFERIAVEALPPTPVDRDGAVASASELMAMGAAAGGTGVLTGGLVSSLLCGPYFLVCLAGTGVAALGGAVVGAAAAGSTALSTEESDKVISALEGLQHAHNPGEELAAEVSARLPAARIAEPDSADARLDLAVQGLKVATGFDGAVALWVAVEASLEWGLGQEKARRTSRNFVCQSDAIPLETWFEGGDTSVEQGLTRCIDDLAEQIWAALQEPATMPVVDSGSPVGFGNYDPAASQR